MNDKIKPVPEAVLARAIRKLEKSRVHDWAKLQGSGATYSSGDICLITGWSRAYVLKLERQGRLPVARRIGKWRGNRKLIPGLRAKPKQTQTKTLNKLGPRGWTKSDLGIILGIKRDHDRRMGRL